MINRWGKRLLPAIFLCLLFSLFGLSERSVSAQAPDLAISKTANVNVVTPGGEIEYTIEVTNNGSASAPGVVVEDAIPDGTTYVADSANSSLPTVEYSPQFNQIRWQGDLAANGTVVITFKVVVNECQQLITNLAVAALDTPIAEDVANVECSNDIVFTKTSNVAEVEPGGDIEYTIQFTNDGANTLEGVVIEDGIPAGTEYIPGSLTATAPQAEYSSTFNHIRWEGDVEAGQTVTITFRVAVIGGDNDECPSVIHNVAEAIRPGAALIKASKDVQLVGCEAPSIELTKQVFDVDNQPVNDVSLVPGQEVIYQLELSSSDVATRAVHIQDELPVGLVAVAVEAESGEAQITNEGQMVVWEGPLGPNNSPVIIKIRARLTERAECGQELVNVAHWSTEFHTGQSNEAVIVLACRDLGDAPDSSNHPGAGMTAYTGVPANFPTVFEIAPPERGPAHVRSRPFHLGRRVSQEREADTGPDADGVNNIVPTLDRADLDRFDDGLERDTLDFEHCQAHRFPIWVSIDSTVKDALVDTDGLGYLNVWLDSNRDGDWSDLFEDCPGDFDEVFEHIVIDWPVKVGDLGPGRHRVFVETSRPVYWPADLAEQTAWLRVTLSETKSNKTLPGSCTAPDCPYGDGRGYDDPFRYGETEDYLLRPPAPDPTVEKRGYIYRDQNSDSDTPFWAINWVVAYENKGNTVAENVHVIDTYGPGQELARESSYPSITPVIDGRTLDYEVGSLKSGQEGHIFIQTRVPFETAPGTVLTNVVTVSSTADENNGNNVADASVTVPLLPPLITYPTPGTTCSGDFTITGRAQSADGLEVDIYIDDEDTPVATVTPDANGAWSHDVTGLADGDHFIFAVARYNGESARSRIVKVIVNSGLSWDPLSLRFTRSNGQVIIPKDREGRTDENGWRVFLRPGATYNVSVRLCCDDVNAEVSLKVGEQTIQLTDPDNDKIFEGTFEMPTNAGSLDLVLCVICDGIQHCSDGTILIDPEGTVYDALIGKESGKLAEATAICYEAQTNLDSGVTSFGLWPAEDFDQENPQTTGTDGYYSFFTPAGTYQVEVIRSGYQSYRSPDLVVSDTPVEHDVPLTPDITDEADHTVFISDAGFDPPVLVVNPGDVVEWINIDTQGHTSTGNSSEWDSGLLDAGQSYKRQVSAPGTYSYYDAQNPSLNGELILEQSLIYLPLITKP